MTQVFTFGEQICSPDSASLHPGYLFGSDSSGLGSWGFFRLSGGRRSPKGFGGFQRLLGVGLFACHPPQHDEQGDKNEPHQTHGDAEAKVAIGWRFRRGVDHHDVL
jgi:hypothetical protein